MAWGRSKFAGRVAWALLGCLLSPLARADWHEASSEHFVIYGDESEKTLHSFSERLEYFHAAMAFMLRRNTVAPSPSNRVTILVVSNAREVRELHGGKSRYVGGFYRPRAGASVAVIPKLGGSGQGMGSPETILLHEYAHHFMSASTSRSFPRWFSEGFAEFYSGARFTTDQVGLGTMAIDRAYDLAYQRKVPIRTLLSYDGGASQGGKGYDSFYAQAWALYHYLQFSPDQVGALVKYQQLLAGGESAIDAAQAAFGDLDKLDDALEKYVGQRKLHYTAIKKTALEIGTIGVRKLPEGEAAIMETRIRSRVGVTQETAPGVAAEARRIAARYPDDPAVLTALAEAEFDAGFDDAAIAAADRAIAIDPKQINAHIQKGYALARKVRMSGAPPEAWKDVRTQWVRANKAENDNPIPLVQFYETYLDQGLPPTANAISGLEWAMQLAPFDESLRWQVAQQMVRDGRYAAADATLRPLAYSPHPGEQTDQARNLLEEIQPKLATAAVPDTPAANDASH